MAFSIEAALVAWLPDAVGVPSYAEVPDPRPDEFTTVERVGGTSSVGIDAPVVAVQAWAKSRARAEEIALDVRDMVLVRGPDLVPEIRGVTVAGGPYQFADPDSRQERYQIQFSFTTI